MRHRRIWPVVVAIAACSYAAFLFDWEVVSGALLRFDVTRFVLLGGALSFLSFVGQTIRWAAISGVAPTPAALWETHLQSSVSVAVGLATPFGIGEALKIKLARDQSNAALAPLGAAFLIERAADLAAVAGLAAIGLTLRGSAPVWIILAFVGAVLGIAAAPRILQAVAGRTSTGWPARVIGPLRAYRPGSVRMMLLGLGTAVKWGAVVLMWQVTLGCAGVFLDLVDSALFVSVVAVSVIVSLVPAGVGLADVTARAVLIWLDHPVGLADTGAVSLRLLTPLVLIVAVSHAPFLMLRIARGKG